MTLKQIKIPQKRSPRQICQSNYIFHENPNMIVRTPFYRHSKRVLNFELGMDKHNLLKSIELAYKSQEPPLPIQRGKPHTTKGIYRLKSHTKQVDT